MQRITLLSHTVPTAFDCRGALDSNSTLLLMNAFAKSVPPAIEEGLAFYNAVASDPVKANRCISTRVFNSALNMMCSGPVVRIQDALDAFDTALKGGYGALARPDAYSVGTLLNGMSKSTEARKDIAVSYVIDAC